METDFQSLNITFTLTRWVTLGLGMPQLLFLDNTIPPDKVVMRLNEIEWIKHLVAGIY